MFIWTAEGSGPLLHNSSRVLVIGASSILMAGNSFSRKESSIFSSARIVNYLHIGSVVSV